MALYHVATITPTKQEVVASWVASQPWGPAASTDVEVIGAFRFDDPEGQVGIETHLASADGSLLQVPFTYRDAPNETAADSLVCTIEHSALGTRWVYDGLGDDVYVRMLAAVAMTGQGEALGMVERDGRWTIAPTNVRIRGGGWGLERVPVDGFTCEHLDASPAVMQNDRFELTVHRRPVAGPQPPMGLTATWQSQPEPVVLAEVRQR